MDLEQNKNFKNRIDRAGKENLRLKEKLSALREENEFLKRALKDSLNLFKDMPGGAALIREEKIVRVDDTAKKLLEYHEEDILGRSFLDFIHPDYVEHERELYRERISGRLVPDHHETCLITRNGGTLRCEVRIKKTRHQGRSAFLMDVIEIDHIKQMEMQSARSRKKDALTCMASGLSLELENCMDALDEVMSNPGNKAVCPDINQIEAVREKWNVIIQKLDTLKKVKHGRSDAALLDLREIIQDAVELAHLKREHDPEEEMIRIKSYLGVLSPVEGFPGELRDVFVNIILNAMDAMPDGGDLLLTSEEDSGFAHVYIQDNGVGISKDIKETIFDPYFTTKKDSATGIGLSLANAIITRHAGEIEVLSRKGWGSTFIVKLPLARKTSLSERKGVRKKINGSHILILADEGMIKELLSQLLMSKGGRVIVSSSDKECLKLLKKNEFDLIIADSNMSSLRAFDIIPKIKKTYNALPVILVNAPDSVHDFGADLVIGAPLDMDRVLSLVSKLLFNPGFSPGIAARW